VSRLSRRRRWQQKVLSYFAVLTRTVQTPLISHGMLIAQAACVRDLSIDSVEQALANRRSLALHRAPPPSSNGKSPIAIR
jgi:hypothetical protein